MICAFPLGSTVMPARGVPLWSVRPKVARRGCRARRSIVARSEGTPDRLEENTLVERLGKVRGDAGLSGTFP